MKKTIITLMIILTLLLTACSAAVTTNNPSASGAAQVTEAIQVTEPSQIPEADQVENAPVSTASTASVDTQTAELSTNYTDAVPVEAQLLMGTLKLNGTAQALKQEQAAALLPLWKSLQTISQSMIPAAPGQNKNNATPQAPETNTETQAQIDALVKQILAIMTPEQIQSISRLHITRESSMAMMQAMGITMNTRQPRQADAGMGKPPASDQNGKPPADGTQPGRANPSGSGMLQPEIFDALILSLGNISGG